MSVHPSYIAAMRQARNSRDIGTGRDNASEEMAPLPASATELPGYGAEESFAPLLDNYEISAGWSP